MPQRPCRDRRDIVAARASRARTTRRYVSGGRFERFAIGGGGRRVADRHQQVGAQDEQPGPVVAGGVGADGLDELEGVTVGAEGGAGLGGAQHLGDGADRVAGGEEMVADASRRRAELGQPRRGVAVDAAAPVRGELLEQRVADERVAEAVADGLRLDEPGGDGGVEVVVGVGGGEPGQGDELVGVERRAGDGDALQHLAGC